MHFTVRSLVLFAVSASALPAPWNQNGDGPGGPDNHDGESVHGELRVEKDTLVEGTVKVDVADISSDNQRRDVNVRRDILHTDSYPTAEFTVTKPADLSHLPSDGTVGTVKVTGDLTLHGKTKEITTELTALRTAESVIIEGNIPVKRSDFDIEAGEFVAAVIDDEGTIDLLLVFELRAAPLDVAERGSLQ